MALAQKGAGACPAWRSPANPFDLLTALGISIARWAIAGAPGFSHALRYPVAVKLLEAHKTERGGVALGVASREDLEKAARKMSAERVLVQEMQSGLAEAIVGYRDDPVVGPLVLVGAGGVLAEVYRDYALRIAPVSETEAAEMIEQVKGLAVIRGYRNLPRGDMKALAQAVSALSRLALAKGRPVREAEINPLIVKADGVVAVDALVARKGPHDRLHRAGCHGRAMLCPEEAVLTSRGRSHHALVYGPRITRGWRLAVQARVELWKGARNAKAALERAVAAANVIFWGARSTFRCSSMITLGCRRPRAARGPARAESAGAARSSDPRKGSPSPALA